MEDLTIKNIEAHVSQISDYVKDTTGLEITNCNDSTIEIFQKTDGKTLKLFPKQIEEIIQREDSSHKVFLQVNFLNGKKLLLTEKLIGFKPAQTLNLDMTKLPKVVTTPDLISVVEAIEDTINSTESHPEEIKVLEKVYSAVLKGAEDIGFSLPNERTWIQTLNHRKITPSA